MQDLLLLHGAIGSKAQLQPLSDLLMAEFRIHTMNFSGHGGNSFEAAFSIEQFSTEVLAYLDLHQISKVHIFGYSMGGFVAMCVAKQHPDRIKQIFTLATKWEWTPEIAVSEIKMLDSEKIVEKIPQFAAALEKRHAPNDWKKLLAETANMMTDLGNLTGLTCASFNTIPQKVRLAIGDQDAMVSLEETIAMYRSLPDASFMVFPETSHAIDKLDPEMLAHAIKKFFRE